MPSARACLLLLLAAALALSGCTQFSGPEKKLSVAVSEASTAVDTSGVAVAQFRREHLTTAVATTALTDMLGQVDQASKSAGSVPVSTRRQRVLRTRAVRRIADAKAAILDARDALRHVPGAPPLRVGLRRLHQAAAALDEVATRLPGPR